MNRESLFKNKKEHPAIITGEKHGNRRKSLIRQFSGKLSIFVVIIFVLLGGLSIRSVSVDTKESYTKTVEGMLPVLTNSVSLWSRQFVNEMHMYSSAAVLSGGSEADIVNWLESMKNKRSKQFSDVFFCGKDGIAHTDSGKSLSVIDRDYYSAIMIQQDDVYIGNPLISKLSGDLVYQVSVSAYNSEKKRIGFFTGIVNLDRLVSMITNVKVGDNGYLFVLDGTGTVIAHPDKHLMLENLTKNKDSGLSSLAKHMVHGQAGKMSIVSDTIGKAVVFYAPIDGTPWSAAAVIPEQQVNRTANQLGKSIFVECLIFGLLLVIAGDMVILEALKPLKGVNNAIHGIASGDADLTQRIRKTENNEIGSVVDGFNTFISMMQTIISGVKESKMELTGAGTDLQVSMEDTSAAITQILSDIDGVNAEITNQSTSVEETAGAVTEISQNIVSLEKMIENQASGITEASAAVEQMIGNIGGVDQSMEKMVVSFGKLEKSADNGINKQLHVSEQIKLISGQSEMLADANEAIANIASQTNLLGMNAAIEAAHAGEAGKGFSVVADEIRKLSETSGAQSKTIGEELKKIRNSIETVVAASVESESAFSSVTAQIKDTDSLIVRIKDAMKEQLDGSKQIGEALHMMNDSTSEVRNASSEMSSGQQAILEEVKRLQTVTVSMKDKVDGMLQGARKISETGKALDGISGNVKTAIERIGCRIDQFKV